MPEFFRVAAVSDLAPGHVMAVRANDRMVALCNVHGVFYAVDNVCIHRGGPLGQGYMEGYKVECPWHGWQFDCRTGMMNNDPGMKIPTYEVKVEGEDVLVAV